MSLNPDYFDGLSSAPRNIFTKDILGVHGQSLNMSWGEIVDTIQAYASQATTADSKVVGINDLITDFLKETDRILASIRTKQVQPDPQMTMELTKSLSTAITWLYESPEVRSLCHDLPKKVTKILGFDIEKAHSGGKIQENIITLITPSNTIPFGDHLNSFGRELLSKIKKSGSSSRFPSGSTKLTGTKPPSSQPKPPQSISSKPQSIQTQPQPPSGKPQIAPVIPLKPASTPITAKKNEENPPTAKQDTDPPLAQPSIARKWLARTAKFGAIAVPLVTIAIGIRENCNQATPLENSTGFSSITVPSGASSSVADSKESIKDQQEEAETNELHRYGFDVNFDRFVKFKKFFHDNQRTVMETALDRAGRSTKIETKEKSEPTRVALYKAFLENALKISDLRPVIREYFEIRLRNLKLELKHNTDPEKLFTAGNFYEDRMLFQTVGKPVKLPDPSKIAGCTVLTNPVQNHALARFQVMMGNNAPSFTNVIYKAIRDTETTPCNCDDVVTCTFDRAELFARQARSVNKQDGSYSMLGTFRKLTNQGKPNMVSDIFGNYREIPKNRPTPNNIAEKENTKTGPAPMHSFNENENSWFEQGRELDQKNLREEKENQAFVTAYPDWFPNEPKPAKPSLLSRAAGYLKNLINPAPKTAEEKELAELKKSVPLKSFIRNLFG